MHIDIKKKMFRNVGELYRNKGGMVLWQAGLYQGLLSVGIAIDIVLIIY
jgi:hypothetical protein